MRSAAVTDTMQPLPCSLKCSAHRGPHEGRSAGHAEGLQSSAPAENQHGCLVKISLSLDLPDDRSPPANEPFQLGPRHPRSKISHPCPTPDHRIHKHHKVAAWCHSVWSGPLCSYCSQNRCRRLSAPTPSHACESYQFL